VTHPSQPNYAAVVAGDTFGLDNDEFIAVGNNISTVVDLLDTKGISWGEYQEHQPYPGFQGFNYSLNQVTYPNDYVRKHNPLIRFGSVNTNQTRLSLIKNFTNFDADLKAQKLPQWSFVTPNMTNDGHDTSVTVAGSWARNWLTPLLNNSYFMENTLVLLTFDETETYTTRNVVYSLLLGGAVPKELHGTTDDTFYNHYSAISSVSVNWGLPSLGRWDCEANVFETVANATKYENFIVNTTNLYFNYSYPGPLSDGEYNPVWPVPDTSATCASGKGVLPSIATTWGKSNGTYNYTTPYPYDAAADNGIGGAATLPSSPSATNSGAPKSTTSSAASALQIGSSGAMAALGAVLAFL
jgi:acid phosphatase